MSRMFRCVMLIWVLANALQVMHAQAPLAQADLRVIQDNSDVRQMLPAFLNKLAQDATEKRVARLNRIRTENDFRNWQEANRRKFLDLIGGLPGERTSLHARVTGEIPREG